MSFDILAFWFLPFGQHTINIVPIVARGCRLGFGVVIAGGVCEVGVVGTNGDACPIACRAAVVNGVEATAIGERIRANACYAIRNGDACKATATRERIIANACTTCNYNGFERGGNIILIIRVG